jgi:hypothetical protein
MTDTKTATYAWIIDKDHLDLESSRDEAGTMGPRDAPDHLCEQLVAGEGVPFRIFDDDGELYYSGRIMFTDPPVAFGDFPEEAFGPLWDFAGPNAGATEIHYQNDAGKWVVL